MDLFVFLQRDSIRMLQELSGKVWTDFNAHDPGVTILDVLNYALTELEYKLSFSLVDYLTDKDGKFRPEMLGLFLPEQVFPTNPVTLDDYRKLFLMQVPELENVWIDTDSETGCYFIHLELFGFMKGVIPEEIKRRVEKLFMSHRNLCETLGGIDFVELEGVWLEGEVNMEPGTDVTAVLVEMYHCAHAYLARHVSYDSPELMKQEDISPDEWLNGPNDADIRISAGVRDEVRTETRLYQLLCRIPGVRSFHSCYIRNKEGQLINRFEIPCGLIIPQSLPELLRHLTVKVDGIPASIRFERFISEFDIANMTSGNYLRIRAARKFEGIYPDGKWRPVYQHDTILDDFPDCYGINRNGLSGFADKERKGKAMQLKAYLALFDSVFARGLKELEELRNVLKLEDRLEYSIFSADENRLLGVEDFLIASGLEQLKDISSRNILKLRSQVLDMLSAVYGEDSNPAWLNEYNYYDYTEATRLVQRIRFLEKVPLWGKDRFRACDLTEEQDEQNVPGVKAYVSALMDWQCDEGRAVGNIFPAYNLNFITKEEYEHQLNRMVKSELIPEQMLSQYNIEPIPVCPGPYMEKDYEEMRKSLPFFYNNLLSDELFRGGIYLENFKLVHLSKQECLLVFRNQEKKVWVTLGRSVDQNGLSRMANVLRDFLLKLNRESETMYVVENQYFNTPAYFSLTIVLSGWSARMSNPRFREICRKLILTRLPAHIRVDFQWLDLDGMQQFEIAWRQWRRCMQQGNQEEAVLAMKEIQDMFKV